MLHRSAPLDDRIVSGNELDRVLGEISARALEFRDARRLPQDVVQTFRRIGVYRALVARRFGGLEASPASFLALIEAISHADASAGWVASFGVSATYLAALPETTLADIYRDGPDIVFAGAIFPPQAAVASGGDFIVSGRWPFASGCTGAALIGVGIAVAGDEGGLPRTAVMPAGAVRIEATWDTLGLAGTGSHDVVVDAVRVPRAWTFIRGGAPSLDLPIYRYPSLGLAAQVLAVVGLGCARRALDEVCALARDRQSITGGPVAADKAHVQASFGEAEAMLSAARSFFYDTTQAAWEAARSGRTVSPDLANGIRLAATHAAQVSADVARICFSLGGIAAVQRDHVLARCLQDCLVVSQHAFMARSNYEAAGRVLLGRGGRPGYP